MSLCNLEAVEHCAVVFATQLSEAARRHQRREGPVGAAVRGADTEAYVRYKTTISVLVAKGRARVGVSAAATDWPKRIRDIQFLDHEGDPTAASNAAVETS